MTTRLSNLKKRELFVKEYTSYLQRSHNQTSKDRIGSMFVNILNKAGVDQKTNSIKKDNQANVENADKLTTNEHTPQETIQKNYLDLNIEKVDIKKNTSIVEIEHKQFPTIRFTENTEPLTIEKSKNRNLT